MATDDDEAAEIAWLQRHGLGELVDDAIRGLLREKPVHPRRWLAEFVTGARAPLPAPDAADGGADAAPPASGGGGGGGAAAEDAPAPYLAPGSPLFAEYVKMLDLSSNAQLVPAWRGQIGERDALLVIDMQNDFVPKDAVNPDGGRFAVPEGSQAAQHCAALMHTFADAGAAVVATRDYHPFDHCSFNGHGGHFPAHCVQGSEGSKFYLPVGDVLSALLDDQNTRPRTHIAFKGFHEDVDSFGSFYYQPEALGPRVRCEQGSQRLCGQSCLSKYTGCFTMKCSNLLDWDGTRIDVNAPPDILAMQHCGHVPLHETLQGVGVKRLFVCGLALDFCVLDTCRNARENGFDEVYMVLDAARAAVVPGLGQFGSGFLQDPNQIKRWLLESGVKVAATSQLLNSARRDTLKQRVMRYSAPQGGDAPAPFPATLGPLPLMRARAVKAGLQTTRLPTAETNGEYDISTSSQATVLRSYDIGSKGALSPCARVTLDQMERKQAHIPSGAETYSWAYPVDSAGNIARLKEKNAEMLQSFHEPNFAFFIYGGFVYFDGDGTIVGTTAMVGCAAGDGLNFGQPLKWDTAPDVLAKVRRQRRFAPITFEPLRDAGARHFAWLLPGEHERLPHGGFGYLFSDNEDAADPRDCYFSITKPVEAVTSAPFRADATGDD